MFSTSTWHFPLTTKILINFYAIFAIISHNSKKCCFIPDELAFNYEPERRRSLANMCANVIQLGTLNRFRVRFSLFFSAHKDGAGAIYGDCIQVHDDDGDGDLLVVLMRTRSLWDVSQHNNN